ncbi:MAG: mechanosensitive ion channel [Proteobacteria bacterium]|nr:mechanosensitive ion channel [Pseudomonadota bacterium]
MNDWDVDDWDDIVVDFFILLKKLHERFHYMLLIEMLLSIIFAFCMMKLIHCVSGKILKALSQKEGRRFRYYRHFVTAIENPLIISIWVLSIAFSIEKLFGYFKLPSISIVRPTKILLLAFIAIIPLMKFIEFVRTDLMRYADPSYDKFTLEVLSKIAKIAVLTVMLSTAMNLLGINATALLALIGFLGVAIGFALRDTFASLFSTIILYCDKPFVVGDLIKVLNGSKGVMGYVERIDWRTTSIKTQEETIVHIPNSIFSIYPVENQQDILCTMIAERICIDIESYDALLTAMQIIKEDLAAHPRVDSSMGIMTNLEFQLDNSLLVLYIRYYSFAIQKEEVGDIKSFNIVSIIKILKEQQVKILNNAPNLQNKL